jgi:hypothetical protein
MLSNEEITKRQLFYKTIFPSNVFDDIQKRQEYFWSIPVYRSKISGLQKRGFKNPVCTIQRYPGILGFSFKSIDKKIQNLKERGISEPITFIERSPKVLGYSVTRIDAKIEGLKDRGFTDPIVLIKRQPKLLDISFENIDRKLKLARRINYTQVIELIEYCPRFLDYSIGRCFHVVRVLATEKQDSSFSCIKKTFSRVSCKTL